MPEARSEWRTAYRNVRRFNPDAVPWTPMMRKAHAIFFSRVTKPFYCIPIRKRLGWYKAMKRGPDPNMPF